MASFKNWLQNNLKGKIPNATEISAGNTFGGENRDQCLRRKLAKVGALGPSSLFIFTEQLLSA